jgi:hypothetical protein
MPNRVCKKYRKTDLVVMSQATKVKIKFRIKTRIYSRFDMTSAGWGWERGEEGGALEIKFVSLNFFLAIITVINYI